MIVFILTSFGLLVAFISEILDWRFVIADKPRSEQKIAAVIFLGAYSLNFIFLACVYLMFNGKVPKFLFITSLFLVPVCFHVLRFLRKIRK